MIPGYSPSKKPSFIIEKPPSFLFIPTLTLTSNLTNQNHPPWNWNYSIIHLYSIVISAPKIAGKMNENEYDFTRIFTVEVGGGWWCCYSQIAETGGEMECFTMVAGSLDPRDTGLQCQTRTSLFSIYFSASF